MTLMARRKMEHVRGYEVERHVSHSKLGTPEVVRKHHVAPFVRPEGDRPLDVTYWQEQGYTHNTALNKANAELHKEAARIRGRRIARRRSR